MAKKNNGSSYGFSIFTNRVTLYFIFFLSLVYLFNLLLNMDFPTIFFFGLVGLVISFFSKNMIVVLFLSLSITLAMKWFGLLGSNEIVDEILEKLDISTKQEQDLEGGDIHILSEEDVDNILNLTDNTEPLILFNKDGNNPNEYVLSQDQEQQATQAPPQIDYSNDEYPIEVVLNNMPNISEMSGFHSMYGNF